MDLQDANGGRRNALLFIGTQMLVGAQSYDTLKPALDEKLSAIQLGR